MCFDTHENLLRTLSGCSFSTERAIILHQSCDHGSRASTYLPNSAANMPHWADAIRPSVSASVLAFVSLLSRNNFEKRGNIRRLGNSQNADSVGGSWAIHTG